MRKRESNARAEASGGIQEDMADLGKELERARDEAGMDGAALASPKSKAHTLASDIDSVRERYDGGKAKHRATVDRSEAASRRERDEVKRLHNILEDEEGQSDGIIDELQG